MIRTLFLFLSLMVSCLPTAFAQDSKDAGPSQLGAFVGNLLPNGVPGVEEITPLWGIRYSYPLAKMVYAEGGGIFGNSGGVKWQSAFASLRMDIPLETLVAFAMLGLDVTRYEVAPEEPSNIGGGHAGGGLMSQIGGNVWARFDMKLNSKPGTSLYFALGIVFELGGGDKNP